MSDEELIELKMTKDQFKVIFALCGFTVLNGVIDSYNISSKEDADTHQEDLLSWYQLRDMVDALPVDSIKSTMMLIDDTRSKVFVKTEEPKNDDNVTDSNTV
jgi:hypothetical protein